MKKYIKLHLSFNRNMAALLFFFVSSFRELNGVRSLLLTYYLLVTFEGYFCVLVEFLLNEEGYM